VQVVEDGTVTVDFAEPRRGIRLHGRVLARDGTPVPNQSLGLFQHDLASWNQNWVASSTLADGAYVFEGVLPGRYEIYLIEEMGSGLRCVDELVIGRQDVEHEVRLPASRLEVTVLDARSGAPIERTVLNVMRAGDGGSDRFAAYGMTDAQGRFGFTDLRAGTYHVFAYPTRAGLGFARSEPLLLGEDESGALTIRLDVGGPVDVVVQSADGRPLEGAAVIFDDEDGEEHAFSRLPLTDATGRYRAHGLRPGRYRVAAYLDGYQGTPFPFHFEPGQEPEIPLVLAPVPR
jgi:protocatechuate 3,4-dioxygenase beta subunit